MNDKQVETDLKFWFRTVFKHWLTGGSVNHAMVRELEGLYLRQKLNQVMNNQ